MRHRITIQQQTMTKNSVGEEVIVWTTFATVWAIKEPAVGNAYYQAKQTDAQVDGRFKIRYLRGLQPTMRIKEGNTYCSITSFMEYKGEKREIHIMYSEGLD
jgi:SPP1 family predicted phage head-tail adaptor